MKNLAIILAFVLLSCSAGFALSVEPDFIGIQDTGNENLPLLDVGIGIDCETKQVGVAVASNETGDAVEGAMAYLFYTDYTYQPLPNPGKTDSSGKATIPVPGTLKFLTAMFTLRVDKAGFQSREIQFTYEKCSEAPQEETEVPEEEPEAEAEPEEEPEAEPQQNDTESSGEVPPLPPQDAEENVTDAPAGGDDDGGASACPAAAGLALLSLLCIKTRG